MIGAVAGQRGQQRLAGGIVAPMIELVCASANPDKVAEMAQVLAGEVVLLPRPEGMGEVVEDADDLMGNALLKASAVCEFANAAALADDTGLEVDALGGAPGVLSARYAGPGASYTDNLNRLLEQLHDVSPEQRSARFRTVVAVCYPDGSNLTAEGVIEGVITTEPRGAGGFGYDPVFAPTEGEGRTFSELGPAAKHDISHRGRALRALLELLGGRANRRREHLGTSEAVARAARERSEQERETPLLDVKGSHLSAQPPGGRAGR